MSKFAVKDFVFLVPIRIQYAKQKKPKQVQEFSTLPFDLRVTPELAHKTLHTRQDREYRVWLTARSIPSAGSGKITINEIVERAKGARGLSRTTVVKIANSGDGVWWTKDGETLWLRKLEKVCIALDIGHISRPVIARMPTQLKGFRALCLFAFSCRDNPNPISQGSLAKIANRTSRCARGYRDTLGKHIDTKQNAKRTFRQYEGGELQPGEFVNDDNEIVKVMPNTYTLKARRGRKGNVKRINRNLDDNTVASRTRLYYHNSKDAARRAQELVEGDYFFVYSGNRLWERWTILNGKLWVG